MIDPNEKKVIGEFIERELKDKGRIVVNTENTDPEVLLALIDICVLNKLRDANKR